MSEAISERLKQATRTEHEALETRLSFLIREISPPRYTALLAAMYGFYQPWESAVRPWRECVFGANSAAREKTATLIEDLRFHGIFCASLPVCRSTPEVNGLAAALGSMYVMEGATLGGQLITRSIEQQLGLAGGGGYRFFQSYGAQTGAMWREFRRGMDASAGTPASQSETLMSARTAFIRMREWLQEAGF